MTYWLVPCNVSLYDPFGAFENLPTIDWRQSRKMAVGDMAFIYCTKPYSKIMFLCEILLTDIEPKIADKSDLPFHKKNISEIGKPPRYGYFRVKKVAKFDTESFGLEQLLKSGLKSAPQGPFRINGGLLQYLMGLSQKEQLP